jgi:hypothetical protein
MNVIQLSIGFDLRISPQMGGENWFPNNQRLVPEVASPICADPSVWREPDEIECLTQGLLPDFANPLRLARSIDLLFEACRRRGISTAGLCPICITTSQANLIALVERFGPGYFSDPLSEEDLLKAGWQLLGFDVVDLRGMISGLKGCGYVEPSWSQLRGLFREDLNEIGLFKELLAASEFAQARGTQIPEHTPFVAVAVFEKSCV